MAARCATTMVALLLALLSGCKNDRLGLVETTLQSDIARPPANATSIIRYITEENDCRQWPFYPDKVALYPGKHPRGSLLITYVPPGHCWHYKTRTVVYPMTRSSIRKNITFKKKL